MRPGFQLKGWHVGAIITLFFGLVIGTDVMFTVIAYRTFPGEVSAHPFEDGLAYNAALAQKTRQVALGWSAEASDTRRSDGSADLDLRVTARDGAPVDGLSVVGDLSRPATDKGRSRQTFRRIGPGLYRGRAPTASGVWDLSFTADLGAGVRFDGHRRFAWP